MRFINLEKEFFCEFLRIETIDIGAFGILLKGGLFGLLTDFPFPDLWIIYASKCLV
jgi:hypothetical protein